MSTQNSQKTIRGTDAKQVFSTLAKQPQDKKEAFNQMVAEIVERHYTGQKPKEQFIAGILRELYKIDLYYLNNTQALKDAIARACIIGLDPADGEVYFVPRDGSVLLVVSYRGLILLGMRSGIIRWVLSQPVYKGDTFEINFYPPKLEHKAGDGVRSDENIVGVWALAELKEGMLAIEYADRHQIEMLRAMSRAYDSEKSPWKTNFASQARAKVIRRLLNRLPIVGLSLIDDEL